MASAGASMDVDDHDIEWPLSQMAVTVREAQKTCVRATLAVEGKRPLAPSRRHIRERARGRSALGRDCALSFDGSSLDGC